jgi:hypothetical protein
MSVFDVAPFALAAFVLLDMLFRHSWLENRRNRIRGSGDAKGDIVLRSRHHNNMELRVN